MTPTQDLSPKDLAEIVPIIWQFTDGTTTINSATVTVTDPTSADPTPSAMLFGSVALGSGTVAQFIQGGIVGITYNVKMTAHLPDDSIVVARARLPVDQF